MVTPLKPRIQPLKVVAVLLVYVIISSFILNNPYSAGYPSVGYGLVSDDRVISVDVSSISPLKVAVPRITSDVKLSTLRYWSKLLSISPEEP